MFTSITKKMHCCTECGVRFDRPTAYINHRREEHSKFSCQDCGKVFGLRRKLIYHLRGCAETRKNKIRHESGAIISFSNYKRLPIVTAKELDVEFETYMNRKFGKKGIFRNEKMCKFCCQTFVMASDFADHIRDHYKSIPLDATAVKSKFDFMHSMGLKIRETSETDCSDTDTLNELKNKMPECRVVIIGESCGICGECFKCLTDLDQHKRTHHSRNNRNKITVVLRIGDEIISRIPLRTRHIRRGAKIGYRSHCKRLRNRLNEMYNSSEYSSNMERRDKSVEEESIWDSKTLVDEEFGFIDGEEDVRSVKSSTKEARRAFRLQNEIHQSKGNITRLGQEERGRKEIVEQEDNMDAGYKAQDDFNLENLNYETKARNFELESERIYADELFESMQFSEPWKDEFIKDNGSWYSEMKLDENDLPSDEGRCYCLGTIAPRLTPKKNNNNVWEHEHYNNIVNDEETRSCHEISFHESPPIYKYSSDSKYQADFSFPSDEKSYGFRIEHEDIEETNNNESCAYDYKSAIFVKDKGTNLTLNHSRSSGHERKDKSYDFQEFETGKTTFNANHKYQEVVIKEEVMLEDFTCYINDVYPSLSHFTA